jgi:hypothetical protein
MCSCKELKLDPLKKQSSARDPLYFTRSIKDPRRGMQGHWGILTTLSLCRMGRRRRCGSFLLIAIFACGVSAAADGDPSWHSTQWSTRRLNFLEDMRQADRSNSLRGWGLAGSAHDSIREPLARSKAARDGGPVMLAMHLRGCGSRDHDMGMSGNGSPRMSDGRSDRGFSSREGYSKSSSSGMSSSGGSGGMGQSQMSSQGGSSGMGSGPGMSAMSILTEKCLNVLQVCACMLVCDDCNRLWCACMCAWTYFRTYVRVCIYYIECVWYVFSAMVWLCGCFTTILVILVCRELYMHV